MTSVMTVGVAPIDELMSVRTFGKITMKNFSFVFFFSFGSFHVVLGPCCQSSCNFECLNAAAIVKSHYESEVLSLCGDDATD